MSELSLWFESLLNYVSNRLYIPADVIELLKSFYCFKPLYWNVYLFNIRKSSLYNIVSQQECKFNHTFNIKPKPQIIVNNCKLPESISKKRSYFKMNGLSCNWSCAYNDGIINFFHTNTLTKSDGHYPLKIPSLSSVMQFNKYHNHTPSISYDATNSIVYATNLHKHMHSGPKIIRKLNLNQISKPLSLSLSVSATKHKRKGKKRKLRWLKKKSQSLPAAETTKETVEPTQKHRTEARWEFVGYLECARYDTCSCMVDNNKYIAIMGGYIDVGDGAHTNKKTSHILELYDIQNQKCIIDNGFGAECEYEYGKVSRSLYHGELNKIIVCNEYGRMECYDMIQNEWMQIVSCQTEQRCLRQQIWICEDNPHIVIRSYNPYISPYESKSVDHDRLFIEYVDMRIDSSRNDGNVYQHAWSSDDDFVLRL